MLMLGGCLLLQLVERSGSESIRAYETRAESFSLVMHRQLPHEGVSYQLTSRRSEKCGDCVPLYMLLFYRLPGYQRP